MSQEENAETIIVDSNNKVEASQARRGGWVIPSFQAIADKIRKEKLQAAKDVDDTSAQKRLETGQDGKRSERRQPISRGLVPEEELRAELFKALRHFFVSAFTIIIKARKLCPDEAFQNTQAFGLVVPSFRHPASLEYVKEVSRKIVMFMNRNICEGAAMQIMIEKNKALHVVQRFVFRTNGSIDDLTNADDEENEREFDLQAVKSRCRTALLRIMNAETIKPMIAPQYSRWSISIGFRKEFADMENIDELWRTDPNGGYFPWKKRPRSLANFKKDDCLTTTTPSVPVVAEDAKNDKEVDSPTTTPQVEPMILDDNDNNVPENNSTSADVKPPDSAGEGEVAQISESLSVLPKDNTKPVMNDECKTVCFPLSSFPITSNSMISVYGLEYAAPVASAVPNSLFSPKTFRSPSGTRIAQLRHRLLKHSYKMY